MKGLLFFFSSRRRHTRLRRDWSSDVCSSDLRIWTGGCIIKSKLMEHCVSVLKLSKSILDDNETFNSIVKSEQSITLLLKEGMSKRIALPCFNSAYNYWISMTTDALPANIIQAQRDYFGAHTYQRVDEPLHKFFHTNW